MGPGNAGGGSGVTKDASADQGPAKPCDSARTFQVCRVFGVSAAFVVHCGELTSPESCTSVPDELKTWKRYCSVNEAASTLAFVAAKVATRPPMSWPSAGV